MKLAPFLRQRRLLLPGIVLAALALFVAYDQWQAPPETPPTAAGTRAVRPPAGPAPAIENEGGIVAGDAGGNAAAAGPVDIFAVRDWEPPPPPPPPVEETPPQPPPPPPPPEAPPLPFRYLGKVEEGGRKPVFFLAQGEKILAVRPGEVIDGIYRVGEFEDGQLGFLYRPLKIKQFLSVGGAS